MKVILNMRLVESGASALTSGAVAQMTMFR